MADIRIQQKNIIITCPDCGSWLAKRVAAKKGSEPSITYECSNRSCGRKGVKLVLTTLDVVATEVAE